MSPKPDETRPGGEWQPTYPVWAGSVFASTFAAGLAAPAAAALATGRAVALPLDTMLGLVRGDADWLSPVALAVLAMATVAASVPPGLLSLFLITLTEARLLLHPLVGALTFGLLAILLAQSLAPAVFGFVFGLVSVGGTAAGLALHRHFAGARRGSNKHG